MNGRIAEAEAVDDPFELFADEEARMAEVAVGDRRQGHEGVEGEMEQVELLEPAVDPQDEGALEVVERRQVEQDLGQEEEQAGR